LSGALNDLIHYIEYDLTLDIEYIVLYMILPAVLAGFLVWGSLGFLGDIYRLLVPPDAPELHRYVPFYLYKYVCLSMGCVPRPVCRMQNTKCRIRIGVHSDGTHLPNFAYSYTQIISKLLFCHDDSKWYLLTRITILSIYNLQFTKGRPWQPCIIKNEFHNVQK